MKRIVHVFIVRQTGELFVGNPNGRRFRHGPVEYDEPGPLQGAMTSYWADYSSADVVSDYLEDLGPL